MVPSREALSGTKESKPVMKIEHLQGQGFNACLSGRHIIRPPMRGSANTMGKVQPFCMRHEVSLKLCHPELKT